MATTECYGKFKRNLKLIPKKDCYVFGSYSKLYNMVFSRYLFILLLTELLRVLIWLLTCELFSTNWTDYEANHYCLIHIHIPKASCPTLPYERLKEGTDQRQLPKWVTVIQLKTMQISFITVDFNLFRNEWCWRWWFGRWQSNDGWSNRPESNRNTKRFLALAGT
jgi:hypothetical protein